MFQHLIEYCRGATSFQTTFIKILDSMIVIIMCNAGGKIETRYE